MTLGRVARAPGYDGIGSRATEVLLIGVAVLTVVLSWKVVNTVFTLRCPA
jgi:uncharacterized membrane protein